MALGLGLGLPFNGRQSGLVKPAESNDLMQWLNGTKWAVGNFDGADEILLHEVPECVSNADCVFSGEYVLNTVGNRYLFNATTLVGSNVIYAAKWANGDITFDTRDEDLNALTVNFGAWDGQGKVEFTVDGTNVSCKLNGLPFGTPGTILDVSNQVLFPIDVFYIGSRGNIDAPIVGQHWNFKVGDMTIPINEGSGNDIKDSTGVSVGTLLDASPENFWSYEYMPDKSGAVVGDAFVSNGNYGLYDNVPVVVDVGASDRAVGTFDGADEAIGNKLVTVGSAWQKLFEANFIDTSLATSNRLISVNVTNAEYILFYRTGNRMTVYVQDDVAGSGYTLYTGIEINKAYCVELYVKDGALKVKVNGVEQPEVPIIRTTARTYNEVLIGNDGVLSDNTYIWNVDVDGEIFPLDEGTGNTITGADGTILTLTDNTPVSFWDKGIANKLNLNPNPTTVDGIELTARGFIGFQTRAELEQLSDCEVSFVSQQLIPVAPVIRTLQYLTGTILTQDEIDSNVRYTKALCGDIPANAILDDLGNPILDDLGGYITTD